MKNYNTLLLLTFSIFFSDIALSQDKLYLTNTGDAPQIYRCNTDGSELESLDFDIPFNHPEDIEIDTFNQTIYWTDNIDGEGIIRKAKLDGSDIQSISFPDGKPRKLWLDTENQEIYWTDDELNVIRKANTDLENVETLPIDIVGYQGALGIDIDIKHGIIYWSNWYYDDLWKVNLDGSNESLVYDQITGSIKLDPDAEFIYCADNSDGIIFRLNVDGSNRVDLLTDLGNVVAFDIDFENNIIYWQTGYYVNYVYRASLDDLISETIIYPNYTDIFFGIKHVKANSNMTTDYSVTANDNPFSVFPNPFKDNIHIKGLTQQSEYQLYRLDGALMTFGKLNENTFNLRTDYIPPGEYILILNVKGKWYSKKIAKL